MAAKDEDALICDFAQYYGVHDYRGLKASHAAVLAVGLPEESRIKKRINEQRFDTQTLLLANIVDYLALDIWMKTADGHKGKNRPKSITKIFQGVQEKGEEGDHRVFATAEAFEAERQRILMGINKDG